ncbi:hypothetical protein Pan216_24210 [Planctomycetes bacterium Pan216]|uniref:Uncharacterized protein n=1 Tax=Kolteria novifilia TaxID=2527975 RepID=A0A518B3J2_9BACT|nr:hypothetical protein Pan216_24210 [Planctomycetes bacterium Pan216]
MSEVHKLYEHISRELLENFLFQVQSTPTEFNRFLNAGVEEYSESAIKYVFTCPSREKAQALKARIAEEVPEDGTEIVEEDDEIFLEGTSVDVEFDLESILELVGCFCGMGAYEDCRFEAWVVDGCDMAADFTFESHDAEIEFTEKTIAIHLPEAIEPLECADKYLVPIESRLQATGLGTLTGGAPRLAIEDADVEITGVSIFLESEKRSEAVAMLRKELPKLGAPADTTIKTQDEEVAL